MRNSSILILEIIWIATGILALAAGFRFALSGVWTKFFLFVLMAIVSFVFAWIRHNQRKKS